MSQSVNRPCKACTCEETTKQNAALKELIINLTNKVDELLKRN